ncbi:MAG: hypothetical protein K6F49_07765 [Saccharofermentans sp.]|nr:hypothetical protein [Saccharofermentans sp.]
MKVNCDYCGNYMETTDVSCPHCGAANTHIAGHYSKNPVTIEELKAYCDSNKLPLDKMHVHIGENYTSPQAFGIYKDQISGNFVVYKNKSDGQRAVRYEGKDEAYAVNELYLKIRNMQANAHKAAGR